MKIHLMKGRFVYLYENAFDENKKAIHPKNAFQCENFSRSFQHHNFRKNLKLKPLILYGNFASIIGLEPFTVMDHMVGYGQ